MKKTFCIMLLSLVVAVTFTGCAVKISPGLNSSLGMEVFNNMKTIELHDISVALYIDQELRDLVINRKIKAGEFSFDIGNAFSAKFIKALAYSFKKINIVESPDYTGTDPIDAIIRVSLQDVTLLPRLHEGFSTVSTETYTRLSIRGEIYDIDEKKIVWVGTTQANETVKHEEMMQMSYQEAGRSIASAIDWVIDRAVGDLFNQMNNSSELRNFIEKRVSFHKWGLFRDTQP